MRDFKSTMVSLFCDMIFKNVPAKYISGLRQFILTIVFVMTSSSVGIAQGFDKGMAAYEAGDYLTAIQEWKPIAENGTAGIQYNLGIIYDALQAYTEAASWYRLAADQGMPEAQSAIGYKYLEGQGVIKSFAESLRWYRLAAEQGSAEAQRRVGDAYAWGNGVVADLGEAFTWQIKSAKQGHSAAQMFVGMAYAGGHGVGQDKILGYMWLTIAEETIGDSYEEAEIVQAIGVWLAGVSSEMTAAEISLGQEMTRYCYLSSYESCDNISEASSEETVLEQESVQDTMNSDQDVCYNVGSTASFALYSRVNGVTESKVRSITDVKFPPAEWPESSRLSHHVISQIYGLLMSDLEPFIPVDKDAMELMEIGTFTRCLEEWR